MNRLSVPTRRADPIRSIAPRSAWRPVAARLAQDASLAALLGGNLFGQVAMHPALADVSVESERGLVLNHAWRRYGTINSLSLLGLVGGWLTARSDETSALWASPRRRSLVFAKDVAVGAVLVTGLASAAGGIGFAHQAADGAVPLADGSQTSPRASERARTIKRAETMLGRCNLASEFGLLAVDALLERSSTRSLLRR